MARSRNIKPGFFKNEKLGEMAPMDRLLFAGLWLLADREGRLENIPKRIKRELFPDEAYDTDAGLSNLEAHGFIDRYTHAHFSVIQVRSFLKHQKPHATEKDSELPDINGYLTVNQRKPNGCITGQVKLIHTSELIKKGALTVKQLLEMPEITVNQQLENCEATVKEQLSNCCLTEGSTLPNALIPSSLNPDSLTLNPDSLSLPPPIGDDAGGGERLPHDGLPPEPPLETHLQIACRATWNAYADAHHRRYGAEPIRNQKINSQVKQFVERIGFDESPHVAAFYVLKVNDAFVLKRSHDFGTLLANAEGYRTQCVTGRTMTHTRAQQIDQTAANASAVSEAMEIHRRKQQGIHEMRPNVAAALELIRSKKENENT